LSGLITPSLDEMVFVAREMERRGFRVPLLIGGATTSRQHTAVKIAPEYTRPTVHVLDASRAVDVVSSLLNPAAVDAFVARTRDEQETLREQYGARRDKPLLSYEAALANRMKTDWDNLELPAPWFVGRRNVQDVMIETLTPYIDWTFFFSAWELKGRFPGILEHPQYGAAARELYEHAQDLLKQLKAGRRLEPRGVYGFWPAASEDDDIILYTDDSRRKELARFRMLRQQEHIADGRPNRSLADFIAPRETGAPDYLGTFAVSVHGAEEAAAEFQRDHDDYHAIMVKALADRLAEAFAEYLHAQARKDWGYGESERFTNEDLIAERYRGIRPAFGYPACPDHSEKFTLFRLLNAGGIGMTLTESGAMLPAASVSGLYFSHPEAKYFNIGRLGRDQVESYARRKDLSVEQAERWLSPSLAYEPEATPVR
jgi:5-methyltetrahydrofolate--homocysteine methyltransferase